MESSDFICVHQGKNDSQLKKKDQLESKVKRKLDFFPVTILVIGDFLTSHLCLRNKSGQFPMDSAWIGQYIRKQSFHSDSWTWQLCLGVKSNCTANNALVDDSIPHLGLFTHWNFSLLSAFSSIINRIILMIGA